MGLGSFVLFLRLALGLGVDIEGGVSSDKDAKGVLGPA